MKVVLAGLLLLTLSCEPVELRYFIENEKIAENFQLISAATIPFIADVAIPGENLVVCTSNYGTYCDLNQQRPRNPKSINPQTGLHYTDSGSTPKAPILLSMGNSVLLYKQTEGISTISRHSWDADGHLISDLLVSLTNNGSNLPIDGMALFNNDLYLYGGPGAPMPARYIRHSQFLNASGTWTLTDLTTLNTAIFDFFVSDGNTICLCGHTDKFADFYGMDLTQLPTRVNFDLSFIPLGYQIMCTKLDKGYWYIAYSNGNDHWLAIVDVSDRSNIQLGKIKPILLASDNGSNTPQDIAIYKNRLVVTMLGDGMRLFDIHDPTNISLIKDFKDTRPIPASFRKVVMDENTIWALAQDAMGESDLVTLGW